MKRLFAIKDTKSGVVNGNHMGWNKQEAKAMRDKLNGGKFGSEESSDRYVVVIDVDHWRYPSGAEA